MSLLYRRCEPRSPQPSLTALTQNPCGRFMPIQTHAIPALLNRPVTTVALSPFGRILRTILPTVCARHPARFTGGLYIPTCTNSPWPVPAYRSDRLRGRLHAHLSANIFRCRFYTCSRQAHYSAGLSRPDVTPAPARCNINLCQRFVTPDVLPTYADEQTRPSIPSGRHGFLYLRRPLPRAQPCRT